MGITMRFLSPPLSRGMSLPGHDSMASPELIAVFSSGISQHIPGVSHAEHIGSTAVWQAWSLGGCSAQELGCAFVGFPSKEGIAAQQQRGGAGARRAGSSIWN